jgi:hypothetical protein
LRKYWNKKNKNDIQNKFYRDNFLTFLILRPELLLFGLFEHSVWLNLLEGSFSFPRQAFLRFGKFGGFLVHAALFCLWRADKSRSFQEFE